MSYISKKDNVEKQYSNDKNLSARIKLHAKHSTNKQGLANWLWEHYSFFDNCHVLELGCGNGEQWQTKIGTLPNGCRVVLSDFSEGMVSAVKQKYAEQKLFSFRQIDIQDIPFGDESFDVVIANHMLYHVPDLDKAFCEVKRVLKDGGIFYSSTIGSGGIQPFLHEVFKHFYPDTNTFTQQLSFTLQNGQDLLCKYFNDVKRFDYLDSLAITETQDLMDWIKSTITLNSVSVEEISDDLFNYFEKMRKKDGAINIPKENGLFVSKK